MKTSYLFTVLFMLSSLFMAPRHSTSAASALEPQYLSPVRDAQYVNPQTTLAVRYGPELTQAQAAGLSYTVEGAQSGSHSGAVVLGEDQKTIFFKPDHPFTLGEKVTVRIGQLTFPDGASYASITYNFWVSSSQPQPPSTAFPESLLDALPQASTSGQSAPSVQPQAVSNYLTLPADIPPYTVTVSNPSQAAPGYIFVAPFDFPHTGPRQPSYLLIMDNQGEIVYYQPVEQGLVDYDFKVLPTGQLVYYNSGDSTFHLMNANYQEVGSYKAGNGYTADLHEFQLLENGHALILAYDHQPVDMSKVVAGGKPDAAVIGLIIQEVDQDQNVYFQWRSWDHFALFDTYKDLTTATVDYVHGNALELDTDGNIMLSSRHMSEITKIERGTGAIIWRLGGKNNMFTFTNDVPFSFQHDIRRLPNGHITLWDNLMEKGSSRPIEYVLDEVNKTITTVWDYQHTPPVWSRAMGNAQRLENGNTFMSWGYPLVTASDPTYAYVNVQEVTPDKTTVFELVFEPLIVDYRAYRFPWTGLPLTQPELAAKVESGQITLGYSWNGATEIASYKVYGGSDRSNLTLLDTQTRSGFETQSQFTDLAPEVCYFQVMPVDKNGSDTTLSNLISTDETQCPIFYTYYMPTVNITQ